MDKPEQYWKKIFDDSAVKRTDDHSIACWSEYGLKKRINNFEKIFNETKPKNKNSLILDAGCGTGVYSVEILKKGFDVVACDYSENMIALVKKRTSKTKYSQNLYLSVLDANFITFKNNSFEYILCMGVLQHLTNAERVIKEFFRVLKPGGIVVINTMHSGFIMKRGGKYFNWYSPVKLTSHALENGFSDTEIKYLYLMPKMLRWMESIFENKILNGLLRLLAHDFFIIIKK